MASKKTSITPVQAELDILRMDLQMEPGKKDTKGAHVRMMIAPNGAPAGRLYIPKLLAPADLPEDMEMILRRKVKT